EPTRSRDRRSGRPSVHPGFHRPAVLHLEDGAKLDQSGVAGIKLEAQPPSTVQWIWLDENFADRSGACSNLRLWIDGHRAGGVGKAPVDHEPANRRRAPERPAATPRSLNDADARRERRLVAPGQTIGEGVFGSSSDRLLRRPERHDVIVRLRI